MQFLNRKYKGCRTIGSLFVCMSLLGCNLIPGKNSMKLEQLWWLETVAAPQGTTMGSGKRMYRFYGDGTYTLTGSSGIDSGTWVHNKARKTIELHFRKGNLEQMDSYWLYRIQPEKELQVQVFRNPIMDPEKVESVLTLLPVGNDGKADPVKFSANSWRIAPKAPESAEAIKQRTLSYLHFQEALYKFALNNKVSVLPTSWFPEPILIAYSNGVRMAYSDELDTWNACFYNSSEATQGYMYISSALRKITLSSAENRFERNLDCIRQLIGLIEKMEYLPPPVETKEKQEAN